MGLEDQGAASRRSWMTPAEAADPGNWPEPCSGRDRNRELGRGSLFEGGD